MWQTIREMAQKAENRHLAVVKMADFFFKSSLPRKSAAALGITSDRLPKLLCVENPNLLKISSVSPGRQNTAFCVSPYVRNSVIL